VANVLRRTSEAGLIGPDTASLAEALDAPLATLDRRMATAPGPQCEFLVPPS
jgi:hypothetical protein